MKKHIEILQSCPLFAGVEAQEIDSMLVCLQAQTKVFEKNANVLAMGERLRHVGVVLSGGAFVEKSDCWGNRSILTKVEAGDMFGEAICCAEVTDSQIDVTASEKSEIMFIDYKKIITTCSSACVFHSRLIANMLKILAGKNIMLTDKIEHLTRRTTREKLLSYLSSQAMKQGSSTFNIPFNRQELADFLAVDRSAMSAELGKLRSEGVLEYHKNHFTLKAVD